MSLNSICPITSVSVKPLKLTCPRYLDSKISDPSSLSNIFKNHRALRSLYSDSQTSAQSFSENTSVNTALNVESRCCPSKTYSQGPLLRSISWCLQSGRFAKSSVCLSKIKRLPTGRSTNADATRPCCLDLFQTKPL